jgi:polyhydroxybutyrate depolymerase
MDAAGDTVMFAMTLLLPALVMLGDEPLTTGNHTRSVRAGESDRAYLLHLPPSFDPKKPTPVVLALHPFATNARMMAAISRLSEVADRHGFIVAYPNGTGRGTILHWNVGMIPNDPADDVGYIVKVLDDLATVAQVDPKRVYATGFSNGAMMCYRLAAELPDRIAAIAPVAGTMTGKGRPSKPYSKRAVPVIHFHGTEDTFVPFDRPNGRPARLDAQMRSVDETIKAWAEADGCPDAPASTEIPSRPGDGLTIKRTVHGPGTDGAEVVLYTIVGGGHAWPGWEPPGQFLGKSALDLKAGDLIWEFFQKHPMK